MTLAIATSCAVADEFLLLDDGQVYVPLASARDAEVAMRQIRQGQQQYQAQFDLSRCASQVDVPVGRVDGNHSYGAICTMGQRYPRQFFVCADVMVGHFSVHGPVYGRSIKQLAQWVRETCYGG